MNHARKYRNAFKIGEKPKDQDQGSLKSPERGVLIFPSFDSIEERRIKVTQSSNRDRGQKTGDESVVDKCLGLVDEATDTREREYAISKHIEGLDKVSKMAYVLLELELASAELKDVKEQASKIGVDSSSLDYFLDRLQGIRALRGHSNLIRDDVATVLGISRDDLKRVLKNIYTPQGEVSVPVLPSTGAKRPGTGRRGGRRWPVQESAMGL